MKRTYRILSVLAALFLVQTASAAVLFQSTFESGTEGWTAFTNASGNPAVPVTWESGSGNPAGSLRHDAPTDGDTSFFNAPTTLLNVLPNAIGGSISWDIATLNSVGDTFFTSAADIQIRAGADRNRLSLLSSTAPNLPTFQSFLVGFSTDYLWNFFDGTSTTVATQAQINDVLSNVTRLQIRAEYWSSSTPDTTFLDNVVVTSPVPEPEIYAMMGVGLALLGWVGRKKKLKAAA